jgi:RimJ/RimL family protein N-acetyltransferase
MNKSGHKNIREVIYQDDKLSLLLRPLEEKDAKIIHEAVVLSLDNLRPFMDWSHANLSVEEQVQRIRKSNEAYVKATEFNFTVFNKDDDEFLMSATLGPSRTPNIKSLSIGYWTLAKHCNKGLATLLTKILTFVAFDYLNCDRVEIGCNIANTKSIRVITKCGFILEGKARNYFVEPTSAMLQNGYHPDRTCLQYSLTTNDLKSLPWFNEIKSKIAIKCDEIGP